MSRPLRPRCLEAGAVCRREPRADIVAGELAEKLAGKVAGSGCRRSPDDGDGRRQVGAAAGAGAGRRRRRRRAAGGRGRSGGRGGARSCGDEEPLDLEVSSTRRKNRKPPFLLFVYIFYKVTQRDKQPESLLREYPSETKHNYEACCSATYDCGRFGSWPRLRLGHPDQADLRRKKHYVQALFGEIVKNRPAPTRQGPK